MDCSVNDRLFTKSLRLTLEVASLQRLESENAQVFRKVWNRQELEWLSIFRHGIMFGATFCSTKMQYREKMPL